MNRQQLQAGIPVRMQNHAGEDETGHVFDEMDILAVEAALGAQRPLLLRGEPGVGKTQLARAAAYALGWGFRHRVVDSRTEARDLLWTEDLVARLAEAQLLGALKGRTRAGGDVEARDSIQSERYITPGPLWWAFDWEDATRQSERASVPVPDNPPGCDPHDGVVVLIDEIDKAESDVPNGLLEALGQREFTPNGYTEPVRAKNWPLVILTTNEERRLPDAFIRRCVVHDMRLPTRGSELQKLFVERGKAHFPGCDYKILENAARMTVRDRESCEERLLRPLPGQAEFLDLIRAVLHDEPSVRQAISRLDMLGPFFLRKHAELRS